MAGVGNRLVRNLAQRSTLSCQREVNFMFFHMNEQYIEIAMRRQASTD